MSSFATSFGPWRFTAMLGAVALLCTTGVLTWGMVTVADLRAERSAERSVPAEESALPSKSEQPKDFAATFGTVLETGLSGWNNDLDLLSKQPIVPPAFVDDANAGWRDRAPDLPLPAPPISQSDPESRRAASAQVPVAQVPVVPEALVPQVPAPQAPAGRQMRLVRSPRPETARPAALKPHRLATGSSYVEKVVEQGDAGEVKFRYRRHVCAPPHMVDVCYMPPENRRSVVVQRW
jgi:hypothetical protein